MNIKNILKIVETEEGLWDVLRKHKVEKAKIVAEHIMGFILNSALCSPKIKKAYAKELKKAKGK